MRSSGEAAINRRNTSVSTSPKAHEVQPSKAETATLESQAGSTVGAAILLDPEPARSQTLVALTPAVELSALPQGRRGRDASLAALHCWPPVPDSTDAGEISQPPPDYPGGPVSRSVTVANALAFDRSTIIKAQAFLSSADPKEREEGDRMLAESMESQWIPLESYDKDSWFEWHERKNTGCLTLSRWLDRGSKRPAASPSTSNPPVCPATLNVKNKYPRDGKKLRTAPADTVSRQSAPKRDRSPEQSRPSSLSSTSHSGGAAEEAVRVPNTEASESAEDTDLDDTSRLPSHGGERLTALNREYRSYHFVKLFLLTVRPWERVVNVLCGYQPPYPGLEVLGGWCRLQERPQDALLRHIMNKIPDGILAREVLLPLLRAHLAIYPQEQGAAYMVEQGTGICRETRAYVWALDASSLRSVLDVSLIRLEEAGWRPLSAHLDGQPPYYLRAAWQAARTVFSSMSTEGRLRD